MMSNLHSSKNAPAYESMAANEGITKAIASFFQDDSDKFFLSIYVPIIYSEGINFDWHNGWKCWTLANKNVQVEESNTRLQKMEGHLKCSQ